jgi:hypothetical protein
MHGISELGGVGGRFVRWRTDRAQERAAGPPIFLLIRSPADCRPARDRWSPLCPVSRARLCPGSRDRLGQVEAGRIRWPSCRVESAARAGPERRWEGLWANLKGVELANRACGSLEELAAAAEQGIGRVRAVAGLARGEATPSG